MFRLYLLVILHTQTCKIPVFANVSIRRTSGFCYIKATAENEVG